MSGSTCGQHPELAAVFDDVMTNLSTMHAPAIAAAYDFGAWESIVDVGGGNGILLSHILRTHKNVRGVLADQPHVLESARKRGFLDLELAARTAMQPCDSFHEVPSGCRAYLMKNVLHDQMLVRPARFWSTAAEPFRRTAPSCQWNGDYPTQTLHRPGN
jgi:hypothetical protein